MNDRNNNWNIKGKNCLITGSSRGIGLFTALELAKRGAHVIIVSHNRERCEKAVDQITQVAGEYSADFYVVDLSSQEEIRKLADSVKHDYDRLDVLVNNVGGWFSKYRESPDGIEKTFALNHLSYFLLTGLLLDMLKQSAPARIINVASDAHEAIDSIHFDNIGFKENYRPFKTYAQSKLANIMFTFELAQRLEGTGVTANVLHPGLVNSELYRNFGILTPIINLYAKLFGKSSPEGAQTSIYLASSEDVSGVNGKYFVDEEQENASEASKDEEAWKRLWQVSEEMTDFTYPV